LSSQVLSTQETPAAEIPDPTLTAWVRFLRAHAQITRELSARLEAEHGLTMSDYDVLIQLYHAEGHAMRRVDIARQVLLTASGITRLLDGLTSCGLVAKRACESDARVSYAVLTAEGLRKVEAARETHLADVEELFGSRLKRKERRQLAELLGRLPLAETSEACST
jgi:DNA-binding MarR family transcriptional regulator